MIFSHARKLAQLAAVRGVVCIAVLALAVGALTSAQETPADAARRKVLDEILDIYVRDGYVYYRALKSDRSRLDGYVSQLATSNIATLSREEQLAFWLNAYNALVLRTIIDRYPIQGRSSEYPARSIRQIPGAFERLQHRIAGRSLALDEIERTVLPEFHDPRVYFALGRGAVGSGRLRSEAFAGPRLEAQLGEVASECASRPECVQVDRTNDKVLASAIFSWHDGEFGEKFADGAPAAFASRSPIERAILALVGPKLLTIEREHLAKNTFQLVYKPFDWSLNDLTGRGGR